MLCLHDWSWHARNACIADVMACPDQAHELCKLAGSIPVLICLCCPDSLHPVVHDAMCYSFGRGMQGAFCWHHLVHVPL